MTFAERRTNTLRDEERVMAELLRSRYFTIPHMAKLSKLDADDEGVTSPKALNAVGRLYLDGLITVRHKNQSSCNKCFSGVPGSYSHIYVWVFSRTGLGSEMAELFRKPEERSKAAVPLVIMRRQLPKEDPLARVIEGAP